MAYVIINIPKAGLRIPVLYEKTTINGERFVPHQGGKGSTGRLLLPESLAYIHIAWRRILTIRDWKGISLGALAGVVSAGVLYQLLSEARDKSKFPMPGELVDVGGHRLHIYSTGQGSPTVVLDSGYTGSWLDWSLVQPEVAKFTTVVSLTAFRDSSRTERYPRP